ncbi:MAG: hypothetical protein LBP69_09630 [Treponema sp.]|nr:hypothetical protein [Treponema sp.]
MEKANGQKESKFNSARIIRQAEKSLKIVFPKAKFFVSAGRPVEVLTLDANGYTLADLNIFRSTFCALAKIDTGDLTIALAKKETLAK